eukprot:2613160-Alexandrium_andersonii.AAC.1
MSASLVGSEMCIRDSSQAGRWPAARVLRRVAPLRSVAASAARSQGQSVSYTHLTLPTICSV